MDTKARKIAIEDYLFGLIPQSPKSLYDPIRTSLQSGGKRARPVLTSIWAGHSDEQEWIPAAAAIELLHTFTLIHDDIMDNAMLRRGQPTIHIAYGMNEAILSGDVMIALAMGSLMESKHGSEMTEEFAIGFRGVCEGQALDKEYELEDDVSITDYLWMIELKTSRVFELSAVLGAIAAGGTLINQARNYARELGLAFQIQDDLLDLTGKSEFGKTIGGDILEGKRSALFVLAMEQYSLCNSEERELLDSVKEGRATEQMIDPIRSLFGKMGVLQKASQLASEHANQAINHISGISDMEILENLLEFTREILGPALADRAVILAGR